MGEIANADTEREKEKEEKGKGVGEQVRKVNGSRIRVGPCRASSGPRAPKSLIN